MLSSRFEIVTRDVPVSQSLALNSREKLGRCRKEPPIASVGQCRQFGIQRVGHFVELMEAARPDVGHAPRDGRVERRRPTLALLHEPERIAQHFARIVVAPARQLSPYERLEMLPERIAAGHGNPSTNYHPMIVC